LQTQIYRYQVSGLLGRSANNEVLDALDPALNRKVKIYRWTPPSDAFDASLVRLDDCIGRVQATGCDIFDEHASFCLISTTDHQTRAALDHLRACDLFQGYWPGILPEPAPASPPPVPPPAPQPPQQTSSDSQAPAPPQAAARKKSRSWLAFLVLALATGVSYLVYNAPLREFRSCIQEGRLLNSAPPSAYNTYLKAVSDRGAHSSVVNSMNELALPILQSASDTAFTSWRNEGELNPSAKSSATASPVSNWDDMLRLEDWLTKIDPTPHNQAQLAYAQGRVAIGEGKSEEARRHFENALQSWPNWPLALNGIGLACIGIASHQRGSAASGQYEEARKYYTMAAEADRSWSFPHYNLGALYRDQLKDFDQSEQEFRAGIKLEPHRASLHYGLALTYYREGRRYWSDSCAELRESRTAATPLSSYELRNAKHIQNVVCRKR
jgi:hypothetical protein